MGQSGAYTGPLEQVGPCQWRIPKSYRADMRVDGIIFADDTADRADQERPGARAGRQRGDLAGHPEGQPGHARHPLGLRLLHRRRGGDRPRGRGRDLARRRRLRHQLRRPAAPLQPRVERRQGPDQAAGRPALPRHPHRRRPERALPVRQAQADQADGAGRRPTSSNLGYGTDRDLPSPRPAAASTGPIRAGSATGRSPRGRPVRHARLGQPFPRSPGRRPRARPRGGRGDGPARGPDHRADPLGLARPGLPGLRRLPGDVQERSQEVRLRAARLAARLCPGAQPGGASLPGSHARGGQLRLVQPPAPGPPGARGLRPGLRQDLGAARHGPGLRRRPQHRQVRGSRRRRRPAQAGLRPSQGGDAGLSRPAIPRSRRPMPGSASR